MRSAEPALKNPASNVTEFLLAGKPPRRVALQLATGDYTYGDLQAASSRIAAHLLARGFKKGDRVLLLSESSFFWVAAYLGILRSGLVCVPLAPNTSASGLKDILSTTEARAAFVPFPLALKHQKPLAGIHLVSDVSVPAAAGAADWPRTDPGDMAALMFTSGSTGKPRGVIVTHRNIIANTESIIQYLELTEDDRIMTVLPLYYCFGTSLLHTHLRVGGSLVIDARFMYPEVVLQRMLETRCTGFAGVPSHFQILLRKSGLRKMRFPALRYVQQAGGRLAPSFVRELRAALPATRLYIMYGQTEATARLSYLPPELVDAKPGSIGKGIPGVRLRVLDKHGSEVQPGGVGEIVAEGDNIAQGYWRVDPSESAEAFRNGKLYTGDLATVDEDGFIYVVDRSKDILKCGGNRVSCRSIEDQLLECEDLLEVAVVGIPDDELGEAVKAFIVPRVADGQGLTEKMLSFCKRKLPPQLVPKEIVVLQSLPKNAAGKVLKARLKPGLTMDEPKE